MGLLDSLSPLTAISDIGSGIANFALGEQNLAYNKSVQQTTWNREDDAVQRRVADLKAAGLSPTLAAGSAASSSSPIQVGTPQLPTNATSTMAAVQNIMKQKQDIAQSAAATALALAQKVKTDSDTQAVRMGYEGITSRNAIAGAQAGEAGISQQAAGVNLAERVRNIGIASRLGVRSDVSMSDPMNVAAGLVDTIRSIFSHGGSHAGPALDYVNKASGN